ncbi:MAG: hypothetical protein WCO30_00905 [bacterium]
MKILHYEDIPRWYTLTIDNETGFPCIKIADDVLAKLPGPHRPEVIVCFSKDLAINLEDFPFYEGPTAETFGFGQSLKKIGRTDGQTTFRLELPIIRQLTDNVCPQCRGKRLGKHERHHCYCNGSGKESKVDWEKAFALSASVTLLASALWLAQETERTQLSDKKQLLTLNLIVERGTHGGSLGGDFSPSFINFLKTFDEKHHFESVRIAMTRAYQHMWRPNNPKQDSRYERHQFSAWQSLPGNLILDVPGDACGIHPSPDVRKIAENDGCEWTCHNVDSPLQQLTLITGLAAMCDLAG